MKIVIRNRSTIVPVEDEPINRLKLETEVDQPVTMSPEIGKMSDESSSKAEQLFTEIPAKTVRVSSRKVAF